MSYSSTTLCDKLTPVLLRTTKYYSSGILYYSVLQSATPLLQRTTPVLQRYSVLESTTPYHKVLLQYYSFYKVLKQYYSVLQSTTIAIQRRLQSTTPVVLCTTKYYSCTTPVLLQYELCATNYYSSTTPYY